MAAQTADIIVKHLNLIALAMVGAAFCSNAASAQNFCVILPASCGVPVTPDMIATADAGWLENQGREIELATEWYVSALGNAKTPGAVAEAEAYRKGVLARLDAAMANHSKAKKQPWPPPELVAAGIKVMLFSADKLYNAAKREREIADLAFDKTKSLVSVSGDRLTEDYTKMWGAMVRADDDMTDESALGRIIQWRLARLKD